MGKWLDSAFGAFRRRKTDEEREQFVDALASAIVGKTFGAAPTEEEVREEAERRRLADEGWRERRRRIEAKGVDVGMFTGEKAVRDALAVTDEFFPEARRMVGRARGASSTIDFPNLTKRGALPKNVATAQVICDPSPGCSLVVNLKYLRDGSLNMADINAWRKQVGVMVAVRRVAGEHRITHVSRRDTARDLYDELYAIETDKRDPVRAANVALRRAG